jgi:hypothetical protein
MTRAPAQKRRGPGFTGQKHHLPTGTSACRIRTCRHQRHRVRGSHKRDRRPPLVRWKLRCPPRRLHVRHGGGRSNGVRPSLSSASQQLFLNNCVVLLAGAGAPRDFMAPTTYDEQGASPERASARPRALTWNYVKVLWCLTLLYLAVSTSTAEPNEPRNGVRTLLNVRLIVGVIPRSLVSTPGTLATSGEDV